jgi:secondary thiamine-phosphate synthase enzyme
MLMSARPMPEPEPLKSETMSDEAVEIPGVKTFVRIVDWITQDKFELINVTDRINEIVAKSGVKNGVVHLQSLHTTASVFINEWQDALLHDFKTLLERIVTKDMGWRHDDPAYSDCERQNAVSHLRGLMLGPSVSLQVRNARVLLGTWQSIILAELDGPRNRSVSVQVMGV